MTWEFHYRGGYHEACGGYLEYHGGMFSTVGGYLEYRGDVHERIMKFGKGTKFDVFYTMVTKKLSCHYYYVIMTS